MNYSRTRRIATADDLHRFVDYLEATLPHLDARAFNQVIAEATRRLAADLSGKPRECAFNLLNCLAADTRGPITESTIDPDEVRRTVRSASFSVCPVTETVDPVWHKNQVRRATPRSSWLTVTRV